MATHRNNDHIRIASSSETPYDDQRRIINVYDHNINDSNEPKQYRENIWMKFKHHRLPFQDQIFLIFRENGYQSLFFYQIQQKLFDKFKTENVEYYDVKDLRFLYTNNDHSYKMHLFADDICRNSFNCKSINNEEGPQCRRIHAININDTCYDRMSCNNQQCKSLHFERHRITDNILETILFIYKQSANHEELRYFRISGREFIETWHKLHEFEPIPNMTQSRWKRLIHLYSFYYFDHEQQLNDKWRWNNFGGKRIFIKLWRTYWEKQGSDVWFITIERHHRWFAERTCFKYMVPKKCAFFPHFFCPYFHLQANAVGVSGECKDCFYGKNCNKWHLKRSALKTSYPIPGNCWNRPHAQLEMEIDERINGQNYNDVVSLIDMEQNDEQCHIKWCHKLHSIFNRNAFQWNKYNGFQILCDNQLFSKLKPLQIIQELFRFFSDRYNQS